MIHLQRSVSGKSGGGLGGVRPDNKLGTAAQDGQKLQLINETRQTDKGLTGSYPKPRSATPMVDIEATMLDVLSISDRYGRHVLHRVPKKYALR